jgi:hypothetical protein
MNAKLDIKTLKERDLVHGCVVDLGDGYTIKLTFEEDESAVEPWKMSDCHGEVVGPVACREAEEGEVLLYGERGYGRCYWFYQRLDAVRKAVDEGWGLSDEELAKLRASIGREPMAHEVAAEAVSRDIDYLRGWLAGNWRYVEIVVRLYDGEGEEVGLDALCGVESCGGGDVAFDMIHAMANDHGLEAEERQEWECRDVVTVKEE